MSSQVFVSMLSIAVLVAVGSTARVDADEPPIAIGQQVYTIAPAPLQLGKQQVMTVAGGTSLVAKAVRGTWVWVVVENEGHMSKGWLPVRYLTARPKETFCALVLTGGFPMHAPQRWEQMDLDHDNVLRMEEFVAGTRSDTLDDLNRQLRTLRDETGPEVFRTALQLHLLGVMGDYFKGWTRRPTSEEVRQMEADYLRSDDIRRSATARQLIDPESREARAAKARAMFKWADIDADGRLTLAEFERAIERQGAETDSDAGVQPSRTP
jgi:hypothetical protein